MDSRAATPATTDSTNRAITLVLIAYLLFAMVDTTTKWLIAAGLTVFQLAFMRYAVHLGITLAETIARGRSAVRTPGKTRAIMVLRAFCLVSSTVVNFVALGQLPLSVTSAILFTSPAIVCIFSRIILNERLTVHRVAAVALGLVGVLVVINPFGQTVNWYAVLMLYPAAGMAMYVVLTRLLAGQVSPHAMQLQTGILGTAALLPFALVSWQTPGGSFEWLLLVSIGALAWFGHEVLTRAHAFADASFLAPFGYSMIVYMSALGWLIFGNVPAASTVFGSLLIFASVIVMQKERSTV